MKASRATAPILTALALLLSLALATPAVSQVAKIKNAGEALVFYPAVETNLMSLTVSGPCNYQFRTRTEKGEIVFEPNDEAFDGAYTFTVDVQPVIPRGIMKILTEARKTGDNGRVRELCRDGKLPTGPTSQSGSFQIVERKIILDTTPEAKRGKRDEGGEKAAELTPEPATRVGERLADRPLDLDTDSISEVTLLASAGAPAYDPASCNWVGSGLDSGR